MPESAIISAPPVAPDEPALDLGYSVAVDAFSGPLDLLLFLVRKSELDIIDIPVATIADQFVALIREWQELGELDLEAAGDFILMAATLLEIKARTVAPPPIDEGELASEDEDDILDPRADLIGKLLAYRRFKEAVGLLNQLEAQRAQQVTRQLREDIPEDPDEATGIDLGELNVNQLSKLWYTLLARLGGNGPRTVMKDDIPIEGSIRKLEASAIEQRELTLHGLFAAESTLQGRVTMLMATLECTRQRIVHATQHEQYGDVILRFREESDRVITPVVFPPEEGGKKRRRRPPLVTFQAPVAPSADESEDAPSEPEEKHETDEERFLRELNESCDLDGVLARVQDVEKGFQAYWEVLHPAPPPPVQQIIPLVVEPVAVAQAEVPVAVAGSEPVTAVAVGEAPATAVVDPAAAVVTVEALAAVEPLVQAVAEVAEVPLVDPAQAQHLVVDAALPAAAEAPPQVEAAAVEPAVAEVVAAEPAASESAVNESLVGEMAMTIAEVLPSPTDATPIGLALASDEQPASSLTETVADASAPIAADAVADVAQVETSAVGAADAIASEPPVAADEQVSALAEAAPLTVDPVAVEQAGSVAADLEPGAVGETAVVADAIANTDAAAVAVQSDDGAQVVPSEISVEPELAHETLPTNTNEAGDLSESASASASVAEVAVESEAIAEPPAVSASEPVAAVEVEAAATSHTVEEVVEPVTDAVAETDPAAVAVEESPAESPVALARTLPDPVNVEVGDDATESESGVDQAADESVAVAALETATPTLDEPSVVEQRDAVSAVPEPVVQAASSEVGQSESEPVASMVPESATAPLESPVVEAPQATEAVAGTNITDEAVATAPLTEAPAAAALVVDELAPVATAPATPEVAPATDVQPHATASVEEPQVAAAPNESVAQVVALQPAVAAVPETLVISVPDDSIVQAPAEPAPVELRPAARLAAPIPARTPQSAPAAPRLWSRTVILLASGLAGGSLAGWLMLQQQPEPLPLHGTTAAPLVVPVAPVAPAPATPIAEAPAAPTSVPETVPAALAAPSQPALVPVSRPTLPEPGMAPSDRLLAAAQGPAAQWLEVATWPVVVPWYACLPRAPLPSSLSAFAGETRLADVPVAAWACDGAWAWCVAAPPAQPFAVLPDDAFSVAPPAVPAFVSTWALAPDLSDVPVGAFTDPEAWRLVIGDPTLVPQFEPVPGALDPSVIP